MLRNIQLRVILNIQIVSLIAFVGETNYHFSKVNSDVSQKTPPQRKPAVQKFHAKLLRERKRGTFALSDIANIDQKSLPFALDNEQWESIRRKWF